MLSYEPSIVCQQQQHKNYPQFFANHQSISSDHQKYHHHHQQSSSVVPLSIETIENCDPPVDSAYTYDYWTRDSLYDRKDSPDDVKSNRSAMTNRSTRQVFDLLAKILPIGVFLLLISLMIHFVANVEAYEPLQSISRLICIVLAMTVIPLSVVFIMKTICDRKDNSCWHCDEYDTDYLNPSRYNLDTPSGRSMNQSSMYKQGVPCDPENFDGYSMKEIPIHSFIHK